MTFAEAEKLVQVELSESERQQAAGNWRSAMAPLYERRVGPRKVGLEPALAPWSHCEAALPGQHAWPGRVTCFVRSKTDPGPLPSSDEDIAFAPVSRLSRWIEARKLSSERLTNIYLQRIERFNPKLHCVITPTRELALAQAKQADQEIAAGHYRGPLHGIPWGAKDLLDTAGIPTTYGAEPFRNRVPTDDATVVKRLHAGRRGAGGQAEHGRAGAQRYLVWRPDKESLAARRGLVGLKRRAGRGYGRGAGGLCHRQRDRGQHRKPHHALRNYRAAAYLRAGAANRRHDTLLVARQARPHDPQCRGCHAGARGHHRPGRGRRVERAQQAGLRRGSERWKVCGWATFPAG